ncbi:MAG: hypothetical protein EXS37_19560 [Opitutus sp.]|nr:hypothetical protein [Opitutus sp.]
MFDPERRTIVHSENLEQMYALVITGQGPRAFVGAGARDGVVTVLFTKRIAQIDPENFAVKWIATSPVPITSGVGELDGRVY